ncbi:MAG: VTT domain-containing protein [Pseudomonadota bacterium]
MFKLRRLYDLMLDLAAHPRAIWWLALVTASESIFFPIPQDVMMVPMMLAQRVRIWFIASLTTIVSVLGGVIGYSIGFFAMQELGEPLLALVGGHDAFSSFEKTFQTHGWAMVLLGSVTPIPYKIVCLASGAAGLDILLFVALSLLGRGVRFFGLGLLCHLFGMQVLYIIDRYFTLCSIGVCAIIIAGFIALGKL